MKGKKLRDEGGGKGLKSAGRRSRKSYGKRGRGKGLEEEKKALEVRVQRQ